MSSRNIALIAGAFVLGVAVAIGATLFLGQYRSMPSGTSAVNAGATSATSIVGAGSTPTPTTTPSPVVTPPTPPPAKSSAATQTSLTANDVTHQATFVTETGVADGGADTVTFDYVQFLTGAAAQKAATAHGDTVENDYYVANDNPRLRTFPVASSVAIVMHPGEGPQYHHNLTLDQFKALVASGSAVYAGQHYNWHNKMTFWINVKNGKVTRIENQWVP